MTKGAQNRQRAAPRPRRPRPRGGSGSSVGGDAPALAHVHLRICPTTIPKRRSGPQSTPTDRQNARDVTRTTTPATVRSAEAVPARWAGAAGPHAPLRRRPRPPSGARAALRATGGRGARARRAAGGGARRARRVGCASRAR